MHGKYWEIIGEPYQRAVTCRTYRPGTYNSVSSISLSLNLSFFPTAPRGLHLYICELDTLQARDGPTAPAYR